MSTSAEQPFIPSYDTCDDVSDLCPIEATLYGHRPNLGAAIFFALLFTVCFLAQLAFAFRMRGWAFSIWILIGLAFEMTGYFARISLWQNAWNFASMASHLIGLILGPSFINAAVSVTFKHIILYCGEHHSKLKAKWYPIVFIGTDFASILIQFVGAALSAVASSGTTDNETLADVSTAILITGVSFQVGNMVVCGGIIALFVWNYRKAKGNPSIQAPQSQYQQDKVIDPHARSRLHTFSWALAVAYLTILIRCCYRYVQTPTPHISTLTTASVPEMASGWAGDLMQNESIFLVLDAT